MEPWGNQQLLQLIASVTVWTQSCLMSSHHLSCMESLSKSKVIQSSGLQFNTVPQERHPQFAIHLVKGFEFSKYQLRLAFPMPHRSLKVPLCSQEKE